MLGSNEKGLTLSVLVFREPVTEVDNCNIADVLFIGQIIPIDQLKQRQPLMTGKSYVM